MRKSKLEIALPLIATHFNNSPIKIFKTKKLFEFIKGHHSEWDLAKSTSPRLLIKYLIENSKLRHFDFPFPYRHESRYTWGEVSIFEVLLTLKNNSYFSHESAMYFNNLTDQAPTSIYLNHEQPSRPQSGTLSQKSIENAFSNNPRTSNNKILYEGNNICIVNGMNTNNRGVISKEIIHSNSKISIRTTSIERTLIDITVRPIYSGGVNAVRQAYALARDKISIETLRDMYLKLKYQYPYHQAIGHYLEITNYPATSIDFFRELPIEFEFYLTNQIEESVFIQNWKLHVPKNMT